LENGRNAKNTSTVTEPQLIFLSTNSGKEVAQVRAIEAVSICQFCHMMLIALAHISLSAECALYLDVVCIVTVSEPAIETLNESLVCFGWCGKCRLCALSIN